MMGLASPRESLGSTRLWLELEPLWIAALALLIILPGFQLGAAVIRLFGRGGQQETVEWLTYLAVLAGLPLGVFVIVQLLPRATSPRVQSMVKAALLFFVAAESAVYVAGSHWKALGASAALSLVTVAIVGLGDYWRDSEVRLHQDLLDWIPLTLIGTAAWMSAGSLVTWSDSVSWFVGSPGRVLVFVLAFAISALATRATFRPPASTSASTARRRWSGAATILTLLGAVVLLALSFRTAPIVDLYHWAVYVGPIQALRQGAWLLWDAPAQYGVMPTLIPTLLPGNAWQSFYVFQAAANVVIAFLMFWAFGGKGSSVSRIILATTLTATTLFFRPREGPVLLAAQMTPSGGPVRFIWLFVILAYVFRYYMKAMKGAGRADSSELRFELYGTLIWLGSVCWSVEAAIYCSGAWFPAYLLFLIQRTSRELRSGRSRSEVTRLLLRSLALPIGGLLLVVAAVSIVYRFGLGHLPDWTAYFEYALLYSGGFHSMGIDPSGSVWFLLIIFLAISTAVVMYLVKDPFHPRVIVLAAAWGGTWALGSYFVSRSHPANLLSIATFLVFAAAITLRVVADQPPERWHALIRVAILPMFVTPIALTLGHPQFLQQITTPQLSYRDFTEQIPLMEPSLNELLLEAGAKPTDPVVRIGDGRLVLPAWRQRDSRGARVISPYSWLPKQYEIIATLPADRRQKYIDRLAQHLRLSGWLVHSKTGGISNYSEQLADIQRTHAETRRFENKDWIVSWYELKQ
jgi:hypothetical protein